MNSIQNQEYSNWVVALKSTIKQRQIKAAIAVNSNLIMMYWDLGKQIVEKPENTKWGSGFIDQLSKDLKSEFPDMGGFSRSNLFSIKNSDLNKKPPRRRRGGFYNSFSLLCFF